MRRIYDFEQFEPPILNENMLKNLEKERKFNSQLILAVVAGILIQIVLLLFGWAAIDWYPALSLLCFGYVLVSMTGGGVIAVVYAKKERCRV